MFLDLCGVPNYVECRPASLRAAGAAATH
jgi:hypothetical protein